MAVNLSILQKMSKLTFDDYYNRLNMQELLVDAGYTFNRRDGLRYPSYVKLDSMGKRIPGDKFLVTPNGKGCFHPPVMKVFNVVSFIKEHPDLFKEYHPGIDPYHLVNLVCSRLLNEPVQERERRIIEPRKEQKPFDIKDYELLRFQKLNFDNIKKFYPYFKTRGLDIPTQKAFSNNFLLASKPSATGKVYKNLSFPLTIPGQKDIVGFEERGHPRLDGSSGFKGKARGSNSSEGLWIASPAGTELKDAKDVLWFESGYDAMAYYQLHARTDKDLDKAVFLSTGGNPTVMQFRGVINETQSAVHHLCFDNDLAGKQFSHNFEQELKRIREATPKVGEDMKYYMDSLSDKNNILSGDPEYLPAAVFHTYARLESAVEECMSMRECGLSAPEDIATQEKLVNKLQEDYQQALYEKLGIGMEQGHLKDLGSYNIPEWALNIMENGDREGLSDEEIAEFDRFMDKHFSEGYVADIDWDDYDEFNCYPAFGPRNPNALPSHGESPFLAVKTYRVAFYHPTEREGQALPNLTVRRELPQDGCKDWNEQLLKERAASIAQQKAEEQDGEKVAAGLDMDGNGEIELNESDERKYQFRSRS